MQHSDTLGALAGALNAAQAELKPAAMNATNPFLRNRYADLGAVIEAAALPLAKYGLSYSQHPTGSGGRIGVETILMHNSGEWLSSTIELDALEERGKSAAQVAGSIITYLRRYALAAVLGIYADEDTDGNPPARHPDGQHHGAPTSSPAARSGDELAPESGSLGEPITAKTRGAMFALFAEQGIDDENVQRRGIGSIIGRTVESRADLTEGEGRRVVEHLRARGKAARP